MCARQCECMYSVSVCCVCWARETICQPHTQLSCCVANFVHLCLCLQLSLCVSDSLSRFVLLGHTG